MNAVLRYIRKTATFANCQSVADQELLHRYVQSHDETAFAALVDRYGPMVLAACRRILKDSQEAEDVLQATFLVLVRKAESIRQGASVGSWLYGVARRIALRSRAKNAQERAYRNQLIETNRGAPASEPTSAELQLLLDEEVNRLPEKYRVPILLCCFQGKSRDEAAKQLGWAEGAVKIRLERGRRLLRQRLTRRGVTLSVTLSTTLLTNDLTAAVPVRLAAETVDAAMQFASGEKPVATSPVTVALAEEMLRGTSAWQTKLVGSLVLLIAFCTGLVLAVCAALSPISTPKSPTHSPAAHTNVTEQPPMRKQTGKPKPLVTTTVLVGSLRSVEPEQATLTIRNQEKNQTYRLAKQVQTIIDGRPADIAELRMRGRVKLVVSEQNEILRIETVASKQTGKLISVD